LVEISVHIYFFRLLKLSQGYRELLDF
jgi:hypothetical protein